MLAGAPWRSPAARTASRHAAPEQATAAPPPVVEQPAWPGAPDGPHAGLCRSIRTGLGPARSAAAARDGGAQAIRRRPGYRGLWPPIRQPAGLRASERPRRARPVASPPPPDAPLRVGDHGRYYGHRHGAAAAILITIATTSGSTPGAATATFAPCDAQVERHGHLDHHARHAGANAVRASRVGFGDRQGLTPHRRLAASRTIRRRAADRAREAAGDRGSSQLLKPPAHFRPSTPRRRADVTLTAAGGLRPTPLRTEAGNARGWRDGRGQLQAALESSLHDAFESVAVLSVPANMIARPGGHRHPDPARPTSSAAVQRDACSARSVRRRHQHAPARRADRRRLHHRPNSGPRPWRSAAARTRAGSGQWSSAGPGPAAQGSPGRPIVRAQAVSCWPVVLEPRSSRPRGTTCSGRQGHRHRPVGAERRR